jgi:hypothetical protein
VLPRGFIAVYRAQKKVYLRCIPLVTGMIRCIRLETVRIALAQGCIAVCRAQKVVYRAPAGINSGVSGSIPLKVRWDFPKVRLDFSKVRWDFINEMRLPQIEMGLS